MKVAINGNSAAGVIAKKILSDLLHEVFGTLFNNTQLCNNDSCLCNKCASELVSIDTSMSVVKEKW